jgi:hypothetical protein
LAGIYESEEQWSEAAQMLQGTIPCCQRNMANIYSTESIGSFSLILDKILTIGIPLDSGHRPVSNDYRCRIYIHIVQLYLEDEDAVSADAYLNRMLVCNLGAGLLILDVEDKVLQLQFAGCQARYKVLISVPLTSNASSCLLLQSTSS